MRLRRDNYGAPRQLSVPDVLGEGEGGCGGRRTKRRRHGAEQRGSPAPGAMQQGAYRVLCECISVNVLCIYALMSVCVCIRESVRHKRMSQYAYFQTDVSFCMWKYICVCVFECVSVCVYLA